MPAKKRKTTRRRATRKTTKRRTKKAPQKLQLQDSTRRQINGTIQLCLGVLLLLVIFNQAGPVGTYINRSLTSAFGQFGALFPVTLILSGLLHWFGKPKKKGRSKKEDIGTKRLVGLSICLASFLGLIHLRAPMDQSFALREEFGGAIGFTISVPFLLLESPAVGYTILSSLFIVGLFVAFEPDLPALLASVQEALKPKKKTARKPKKPKKPKEEIMETEDVEDDEDLIEQDQEEPELNIVRPAFASSKAGGAGTDDAVKAAKKATAKNLQSVAKDQIQMQDTRFEEWEFPAYDLLDDAHSELKVDDDVLKTQARLIEEKLDEFGIEVTVCDAHPGPTVTQFTLRPAEGVKLSKIANLKDDLSLALAAPSLRIQAPIPGKSLVGIEMPNVDRTTVHLREILESTEFSQSESPLTLPLGRDVSGQATIAALNDMPHLLIAGATGSGKSVCMNTFMTALLYQNAPDQLKLILVDPKRVELMPYDGIPHLLTPVITEAEKALQALRWAVAEMGRRLHRFSEVGARNIDEFNEAQTDESDMLPRVVIVIDELADLMMRQYRRDTETMIARIAQMARAVGMHLIIATQRPSVDVITGLIKANIPTRMAFRVVSSIDSRTILDSIGADELLGKGDMLYMTAETPNPVRIQGIFISTKETERVINAVKIAGGGKITEEIPLEEGDDDEDQGAYDEAGQPKFIDLEADDNGGDDLFFDAVKVVQETGKASASLLQRRLSVGYARAAKLLDIMEEKGLIGPARGAKPREVYVDTVASS